MSGKGTKPPVQAPVQPPQAPSKPKKKVKVNRVRGKFEEVDVDEERVVDGINYVKFTDQDGLETWVAYAGR